MSSNGRENAMVLNKVAHVHMSSNFAWVTLQGVDDRIEVSKSQAESIIKLLEEE
jgi:hypothetical protein